MDKKAAKCMAKVLGRKITSFFRYRYYNRVLHKGNNDSLMYVRGKIDLAEYDMTCSLKQAYLEEMGLYEEPAQISEPEPEPESEPGLLQELGFALLVASGETWEDTTYIPSEVKEYIDRIQITIEKIKDYEGQEPEVLVLPRQEGEKRVVFEMDGVTWCWDMEQLRLRRLEGSLQ